MLAISLSDFYLNVRKYISFVKKGEEIIISEKNVPLYHIEPLNQKKKTRPYGLCKGEFEVPENFDEELPSGVIANFEGR